MESVRITNIDSTATIVLDDLVRGVVGSTANNPGLLAGLVVLLLIALA